MFSIIIVAYNPDKIKLKKFLKKIGNKINILVINNSENYDLSDIKFSKKTKIIKSKNRGNGAGINLGLKHCKTKFAIYSDIDINFQKNFFLKFINFSKKIKDFCILVPNHGDLKGGKKVVEKYKGEASMMLFNIKKLKKIGFFDENYFLYYEEADLLHRCKKNNLKSFFIQNLKIKHLRALSVEKNRPDIENLRSWHYMWSMFYFYKKNFGYLKALKKTFFFLIQDLIMIVFYSCIIDKKKIKNRFYRIYGAITSMLGVSAFLRP